jgi:hypothetical protein
LYQLLHIHYSSHHRSYIVPSLTTLLNKQRKKELLVFSLPICIFSTKSCCIIDLHVMDVGVRSV